ncbi:MAG: adenylate kinase [Candidatus Rokuibacteriota bacterium]|nr:MAG: adenylate kinase [Candidatus Rokubacteria bacterium]PYO54598.1 MAG: adenylate kinase [Candidatus Rokubacteria bacterium]
MRVAFLGPPGAGKGTQARELAREWGVPHVATGDMLRDAAAAGTPLGREAKGYMDKGALVPDDVIIRMIAERLRRPDAGRGFLLDGFPRTIAQAEGLEHLLKDLGQPLERVVYFDVSEPELLRRLTGRRVCRVCQTAFNLVSAPPAKAGICDRCGGQLYQREDDSEATVRHRLGVYARQTAPLLDWYRGRGLLVSVPGEGPIETIRGAIRGAAAGARA